MSDDMDLLRAWRQGDAEAGTKLFRRHFPSVFLFFQSKLSDNVDDMVQRTFLACVEAGDRLDEVRSFRAYLLGIARYQLLRFFAERGRGKKIQELAQASAEDVTGPSKVVARREEHRLLLKALRRLPLDLQIAVELFYWEHMPLAEIAAVIEIPEGTVKSRLFRAKKLLRERIEELDASDALRQSTIHNLESWARDLRGQLGSAAPDDDG